VSARTGSSSGARAAKAKTIYPCGVEVAGGRSPVLLRFRAGEARENHFMILTEIPALKTFVLPPDSGGSAAVFARLGYDLVDALADIIDNAVDSKAASFEIIFHRQGDRIAAVSIADTGRGMTGAGLQDAMRFAGNNERDEGDLGTYGLGLKTASFSQCDTLTVISSKAGSISACRWTKEGIGNNWSCEALEPRSAAKVFAACHAKPTGANAPGTLVMWHRLTRLDVNGDFEEFISELLGHLELQLGLIFHRFISAGTLSITLAARDVDSVLAFPRQIRAHDPFAYARSGREGYPKRFTANVPNVGALQLDAHIWPVGAAEPNFRLGRRTGTHGQGFYVYRNDRLVQTGGWLGVCKDEMDAELSLARAAIDLPKSATRAVSVQKSGLQLTAALAPALRNAKAGRQTLTNYLDDARKAYRTYRKKPRPSGNVPVVPGPGVPAAVRRGAATKITKDDFVREIAFEWISLPKATVFSIDPNEDRILLNKRHRQKMLGPSRASAADAPIVKLLLFLLLEHELDRERFSAKRREWLKRCNAILYEAVKAL
jgi:Histidine kinase-, DNA gyrase B-, and HSP90-like ATPase